MITRPLALLIAILLCCTLWPVSAPTPAAANARAGEVLVRLQPNYTLSAQTQVVAQPSIVGIDGLNRVLDAAGAHDALLLGAGSDTYQISVRADVSPAALAAELAANPAVVYAEPNYPRQMLRTPNDSVLKEQWALRNLQAFEAWDITTGGPIVIAVLDTGVDSDHPDLRDKLIPGYNALSNNGNTEDDNGHGTAVSGLIGAQTDNNRGVAGICWGCLIMPVKVLNGFGGGNDATVAQGIRWATDNGANVINLSLGGTEEGRTLREAVDYALSNNVLIVAASGNERQQGNAPNYPAAYEGVLAVSATGNTDAVTGFSNTGDYIDLAAPGVGLWTTIIDGEYGPPNGTSFSSPYVAGVAGLVFTLRPDLGAADVACVLEASADDKGAPGKDAEYGWGRLNALRATQLAQSYTGCPLNQPVAQPVPQPEPAPQPAPVPPQPAPGDVPPAFAPVQPFPSSGQRIYFTETGHSLAGTFKQYWQSQGGLAIFGYPTSEEFVERGSDGRDYTVQYFQRHRFELHFENAPPYNVQLSRIGDDILQQQGRNWFAFPKSGPQPGCRSFDTGHTLCGAFLSYWRSSGLEFDGQAGKSFDESLALFGQPLSEPAVEEVVPGEFITVQWFERARFEDHGSQGVLIGLLGDELVRARGWR